MSNIIHLEVSENLRDSIDENLLALSNGVTRMRHAESDFQRGRVFEKMSKDIDNLQRDLDQLFGR